MSKLPDDDYVAWLRYTSCSIETCDSDDEGAFPVYRHPKHELYWHCAKCGHEWARILLDEAKPACPRCDGIQVLVNLSQGVST